MATSQNTNADEMQTPIPLEHPELRAIEPSPQLAINSELVRRDIIGLIDDKFLNQALINNGNSVYTLDVFGASAFSQVEHNIINSFTPIPLNETEIVTVNGQTGIYANRTENLDWQGKIPISQYSIYDDPNPEIIRKPTEHSQLERQIFIKHLRPPTPPPPGKIIIRHENSILSAPAPPIVIRQEPPRPVTPPLCVIRGPPPRQPPSIPQKVIKIPGKHLPLPPRKVVIERLAPQPTKPQPILIEIWKPYKPQTREVVYEPPAPDPVVPRPKNLIVQWEAPNVSIVNKIIDLGERRENPDEYMRKYGGQLPNYDELPEVVRNIYLANNDKLAIKYADQPFYELAGDVGKLSLVNLEAEGLAELTDIFQNRSNIKPILNNHVLDDNKDMKRIFDKWDKNHDGKIDFSEFLYALKIKKDSN